MNTNMNVRRCSECVMLVGALPLLVPVTKQIANAVGNILKGRK